MENDLGKRLKDLRESAEESTEDLAKAIWVSEDKVNEWEQGKGSPDPEQLRAIAGHYGISVDELMQGSPANPKKPLMSHAQTVVQSVGTFIALIAYLFVGFLWKGPTGALGWASMWVLLFVPVIITSLMAAIESRKPSQFQLAVLVIGVYCCMGIIGHAYGQNFWHPFWAEFLLIPVYYFVCALIERKKD
ncbi:MAG: helix-turn-helix domain-containing protein [Bacilli bacterium]|nr:helix-turn-helix domain-containing protein [Bacilli bacterium]